PPPAAPRSPPFPPPTLFRSELRHPVDTAHVKMAPPAAKGHRQVGVSVPSDRGHIAGHLGEPAMWPRSLGTLTPTWRCPFTAGGRSGEHTSELQSLTNPVCPL